MQFDESVLERLPLEQSLERARHAIKSRYLAISPGQTRFDQAMAYALWGGKMLRGFFVLESARLHGIGGHLSLDPALAIECMHAYSLVHDDLPCMDDDDVRRGRPTVHRKWDEATAVLVGDALQALAFELLAHQQYGAAGPEMVKLLARLAGRSGMVRGQVQDIAAETAGMPLTLEEITELQKNKTGKLIWWSCNIGPILSGKNGANMGKYANALGLAFQITDDILDIEGNAEIVGKAVGKDHHAGKATFVSLLGLEGAKRRAVDLVQSACDALECYGAEAETLRDAARFVISRSS